MNDVFKRRDMFMVAYRPVSGISVTCWVVTNFNFTDRFLALINLCVQIFNQFGAADSRSFPVRCCSMIANIQSENVPIIAWIGKNSSDMAWMKREHTCGREAERGARKVQCKAHNSTRFHSNLLQSEMHGKRREMSRARAKLDAEIHRRGPITSLHCHYVAVNFEKKWNDSIAAILLNSHKSRLHKSDWRWLTKIDSLISEFRFS